MTTTDKLAALLAADQTVRAAVVTAACAALASGAEFAPGVTRDDTLAMIEAVNASLPASLRVAAPGAPAPRADVFFATDLTIDRTTDKAVHVVARSGTWLGCWLPKSQITIDGGTITMPIWLARKNTLA